MGTINPKILKGIGIGCFVLSLILGFVAFERYQTNADSVEAMKQVVGKFPIGDMLGVKEVTPATPIMTKYTAFFAVLSLAGGVACFVMAARAPRPSSPPGRAFDADRLRYGNRPGGRRQGDSSSRPGTCSRIDRSRPSART